ncbi:MAG TPA: lipase maturation factor family protein, partial [Polyangiales bacterium]
MILLISFTSLATQVGPSIGSRSLVPIARRLAKLREDFPTWRRFFYFPTLLWFGSPDWLLNALPYVGIAGAALVIIGGPWSVWALALCYVCYLSLDLAVSLVLPWDALLFETMVLALFLPPTHALPDLRATAAAAPALSWAFRLLLFRVMFGFGKQKFLGSTSKDLSYLKGFLLSQPLASPLGWYAHQLPTAFLKP